MEHTIVYKDPEAYSCFPDIVLRRNGELLVTFRRAGGFSLEALRRGKYDHVDKGARIGLVRSMDGGHTWSLDRIFPLFDPECGEQDPSIAELVRLGGNTLDISGSNAQPPECLAGSIPNLPKDFRRQALDGNLLMINFFQWRVVPPEEKHRLGYPARQQYDGSWSDVEGPWVVRSSDGGANWEREPVPVDSAPLPRAGTSDAVLQLPDGTCLMGIYGADYGSAVCRAYAVRSADGGQTWGESALIARDPVGRLSFEEPALARTPDGHLLAMLRCGEPGRYEYLYQARSFDGGHTWTGPEQTSMWGHPAHLLVLADGRLLCTYGYRRPPYGVRACLSDDQGITWNVEHEIVLRDDGESRDVGYPSSVQLAVGTIMTVYYIHGPDGIRHIATTRWHVE